MPQVVKAVYDESTLEERALTLSNGDRIIEGAAVFFADSAWRIGTVTVQGGDMYVQLWPIESHDLAPLYVKGAPGVPELPMPDRLG